MYFTYVHLKPDMTPFYVGKGSLSRARLVHERARNVWYGRVVKKYGSDNILVEMIECASEKEAFFRERLIIATLRKAGVKLCNLSDGGEGPSGAPCPDHVRRLRSLRMLGNTNTKGVSRTPEAIEKTRLAHIGSKRSQETKDRIRQAIIGKHFITDSGKEKLRISSARRYKCCNCDHVTNAPNMSKHHKQFGHSGSILLTLSVS